MDLQWRHHRVLATRCHPAPLGGWNDDSHDELVASAAGYRSALQDAKGRKVNKTIGRVAIAVAMVIFLLGGVLNVGSERAAAQEPTYELLTVLGSGEQISRVLSTNVSIEVSRDGSTVLFTAGSSFNDRDAYVWTRATGHATLLRSGLLPGIVLSSNGRFAGVVDCLLYTSPSPRDATLSRMPSSA